jgi:hypothetical protein
MPAFGDRDFTDIVHNTNRHAKKQFKAIKAEESAEEHF